MKELTKNKGKAFLLGNEAVVRGALEAGVQFVSTYPGTPASEIGDTFFQLSKENGFYFEYSTNEKVALEAAAGAAFSGLDSLVAMKHFGLNVASDALMPLCYTQPRAGLVIVVADDPGCWSSAQSEENTRAFAYLAHIPILEPSTPQEAKDFIKLAFQLSRKFSLPVMVRLTTRVDHQRAIVNLSQIKKRTGKASLRSEELQLRKGKFIKDSKRFVTMPPRVLEMKKELLEKVGKIKQLAEKDKINFVLNQKPKSDLGIITSGVSYLYAMESLKNLGLDLPVLKLGFFNPLPQEKIVRFIKGLKKVLIVEELEPYLEKEIKALTKDINCQLKIYGKSHLPQTGELKPALVISAIASLLGKKISFPQPQISKISHKPKFCTGCPYWTVLSAVREAAPTNTIYGGGIGCYMMAYFPPYGMQDWLLCMGASLGIAHGIKKTTNQKLITFIGDSTFFHAGIPALINTVYNKSNPLIIIMDNQTTAMTGQQPHPGGRAKGSQGPATIKIEDVVRACQIKHLKIINSINYKEMVQTIKEFLRKKEVAVIIARGPCIYVK